MYFTELLKFRFIAVLWVLVVLLGGCDPSLTPEEQKQIYNNLADPELSSDDTPLPSGHLDYQEAGNTKGVIEAKEDACRLDPGSHTFEWWYYDAHFDDGTSLVVVYYTKLMLAPQWPALPIVKITVTKADGTEITRIYQGTIDDAEFSTQSPYVRIGDNFMICTDDLKTYQIYASIEDVSVNLTMERQVPKWRHGSGHLYFGDISDKFFWLPAIPSGTAMGTVSYEGVTHSYGLQGSAYGPGSGYHDHNNGNIRLYDHLKYWYWSRAQVGPYTVIACNLRFKNKYGNNKWAPIFVVMDSDNIYLDVTADDVAMEHWGETGPTLYAGDTVTFKATRDNGDFAEITFTADNCLFDKDLTEQMIMAGMMEYDAFVKFQDAYNKSGILGVLPLLNYEQKVALLMLWGDDGKGELGMDPTYVRYKSAPSLRLYIQDKGIDFEGNGVGTIELMDLE